MRCQQDGQWSIRVFTFLLEPAVITSRAQEIPEDQALKMGMQVRLRFFYGHKRMGTVPFTGQSFKFKGFQAEI